MMKGKLLKFPEFASPPVPSSDLKGPALEEWQRVAPTLRRLGRLDRTDVFSLEFYCSAFASLHEFRLELSKKKEPVRGAVTALKILRRSCQDWALEFGFALDREGRMNLRRPLPLSTKDQRAAARIEKECERRKIPTWLAPDSTLSLEARGEYYRVLALPRVRRRFDATADTAPLNEYCKAFEMFLSYRRSLNRRGQLNNQQWTERRPAWTRAYKHYAARCQVLAREMGFFFKTAPEIARARPKKAEKKS